MMEYTKGDWRAFKSLAGGWIIATENELIVREARHYNAHLIASAPELYEACKLAEKLLAIGVGAEPSPVLLMIERAIAKAEGK